MTLTDYNERSAGFFVVGAAKAGTTFLHELLGAQNGIFMSPIKEPNYYSQELFDQEYRKLKFVSKFDPTRYLKNDYPDKVQFALIQNPEHYKKLFQNAAANQLLGESSTSYLYSELAARNISENVENAKIVAILRNPVERAFSHYLMNLRMGLESRNFKEAMLFDYNNKNKGWSISNLYIELGLYHAQLKRYFDHFEKSNIHIILYEDLKADLTNTIQNLLTFLIKDPDISTFQVKKVNAANVARFPKITNWVYKSGLRDLSKKILTHDTRDKFKSILFSSKTPKLESNDYNYFLPYFREDIEATALLTGLNLNNWTK